MRNSYLSKFALGFLVNWFSQAAAGSVELHTLIDRAKVSLER